MIGDKTNPEEMRIALSSAGPIANAVMYNNGKELANALVAAGASVPGTPTGSAGGVLAGTYPNPSLAASIQQSPKFTGNSVTLTLAETTGTGQPRIDITDNTNPFGIASEGLQAMYDSNTGHSYIRSTKNNGNLYLGAGSVASSQVYVDPSGRLRTPNRPVCQLYRTSNTPAGNAVTWTGTYVNIGSMWNGTTTVTVPVAGTYLVTFEGMSTLTTNAQFYIDIWRNGSWITTLRQYHYTSGTAHKHLSLHAYLSLAANDYIWWVVGTEAYGDPSGYCHGSLALIA